MSNARRNTKMAAALLLGAAVLLWYVSAILPQNIDADDQGASAARIKGLEQQTIVPTVSDTYLANPGIGWQYMTQGENILLPESVRYFERAAVSWALINTAEDVYDWSVLDSRIAEAADNGKQSSFRIYTMRGEQWGGHQVPQWVIDKGAQLLNGSPLYSDCVYQAEWAKFVDQLRLRYDGDARIAFIDISGYGDFNEWSWNDDQTQWDEYYAPYNPDDITTVDGQARKRLVDIFIGGSDSTHTCNQVGSDIQVSYNHTGFQSTQLVMPYAGLRQSAYYALSARSDVGLRQDCLGRSDMTVERLQTDLAGFIEDRWLTAPVVFEVCDTDWTSSAFVDRSKAVLQFTHGSIVHNNPLGNPEPTAVVESVMKAVGYRYQLNSVTITNQMVIGDVVNLQMQWQNVGYARNYPRMGQDFAVQLYLADGSNNIVHTWDVSADANNWLPATILPGSAPVNSIDQNIAVPSITAGSYKLGVNIVNTTTQTPIQLPHTNKVASDIGHFYYLTDVQLTTTGDPSPDPQPDPTPDPNRELVTVHRFWSDVFKKHFFTASISERDKLINTDSNWDYEGLAYRAISQSDCEVDRPVYRFYSSVFQSHFYTVVSTEREKLQRRDPNWDYENVAFCTYASETGHAPVYRFYSPNYEAHFFTTSESEKQKLVTSDPNWKYEGVAYYVDSE